MTDAIINVNGDQVQSLEIILFMGLLSILPSLIIMMTSFGKFIISLSFLRTAMGTQQAPPNMILVGMALILTFFVMNPTLSRIYAEAYVPYAEGELGMEEFFDTAQVPLKEFMARNSDPSAVSIYCSLAGVTAPEDLTDLQQRVQLPLRVIMPAFVTSELKEAFTIGFLVYLPFMLIDVVVSSTLMSMGMIMLPPAMISTPFKLLFFILKGAEMDTSLITDVLREGMWVVIQIAAPMLLLSMFVGIVLAVFQAVTQIHEQTLSFVFKLTVVVSILLLNGGWMMDKLIEYAESLYALIQA